MTGDRILLVGRQRLSEQPSPPFGAEQIGVRAGRHQVRVQDRLDDRLQPRPLTDDLIAARDLPPQRQGALVRHPDLRQEAAGVEPRQHGRVDDIGLDARLGDQTHLARIGDHDPPDMGADHLRHRRRVAGRLDHDVVVMRQLSGERRKMLARHPDAAEPDGSAVVQHHRLGEHAVDVQAYDPHGSVSFSPSVHLPGAGGQHGNYGSALAAHPGEPQGRPDKGSGSQPMVQGSACPHLRAPGAPVPDGRTIPPTQAGQQDIWAPRPSCRITARPSASSRPACANGPTCKPFRARPSAPRPCAPGSTATTTTTPLSPRRQTAPQPTPQGQPP